MGQFLLEKFLNWFIEHKYSLLFSIDLKIIAALSVSNLTAYAFNSLLGIVKWRCLYNKRESWNIPSMLHKWYHAFILMTGDAEANPLLSLRLFWYQSYCNMRFCSDRQIEVVRGKLIAVTPREVGKVNPALRLKSRRGKRGSSGSLLCRDTGAKWYIPAYGTVQTTDGDSLWAPTVTRPSSHHLDDIMGAGIEWCTEDTFS